MPPKPKYTKEELLSVALDLTRENGIDAVVARNLGQVLNVSPSTVFTHFDTVEDIRMAVIEQARSMYNEYVEDGLNMTPPLKGFGMQYVRFAKEEPRLFMLLFMQKQDHIRFADFIVDEGHYERILLAAEDNFSINREQAEFLYHNLFTYAHGIATMLATGACDFSMDEISQMLGLGCRSFMIGMKLERDVREGMMPAIGKVPEGMPEDYFALRLKK
ncbi:MAG: TetR/AcrR family transcriptional regulator [Lachnospiraceae bacterium]|nr:TetR/AcrR family transcriptional regulator [Lachnospiraceae bacterium]